MRLKDILTPARAASSAEFMTAATQIVVVGAAYFILAKLSLGLASIHPSATPIWPPTGLALAAVLLCGYRVWPGIFVAALIVNYAVLVGPPVHAGTAASIATSIPIAAGNTLESLVGAHLVDRWSGGRRTFATPLGVARFALISLAPSTVISATIGVASLSVAGFADWSSFAKIWLTWWMGDLAGALVIAPVIVLWADSPARSLTRAALLRSGAVFLAAVVVGLIAFSPLIEQTGRRAPLAFLAILPLMWAALRRGQRDTVTTALILSAFAIWGAVSNGGPLARPDLNDSFLLVLAFMISISVPSLALSADVAERGRAEAAVAEEIGERARNEERLVQMVAALDESRVQLKEHARVLDLANILVRDIDGRITLWNEGARRLYGWTKQEAVGRISRDLMRTQFPRPYEEIAQQLVTTGSWDGELNHRTKDDQRVVSQSHWELHRSPDGMPVAVLETNTDITDRKRHEEHVVLVMRELSHRSKNLLAIVLSIARQVARQSDNFREFETAFSSRIGALADTHDLLVAQGWRGADLLELVRAHLTPFGELSDSRLALEGPDLRLRPKAAEQIGLAVHELATNAARFGAFSLPAGSVKVEWKVEPDGDAGSQVRIKWTERNGPVVSPPQRQGFGHMVLTRVVAVSLQGSATLEFDPGGICWTLAVPASGVLGNDEEWIAGGRPASEPRQ